MKLTRLLYASALAVGVAVMLAAAPVTMTADPQGGDAVRGRPVLSGWLLVLDDQGPREGRLSRQRAGRQRDQPEHQEPGRLDPADEIRRLHGVPSARHERDARDSEGARHVPQLDR